MFARSVLSIRPFRSLWLGQTISLFGDSLFYVTNAFMVKLITGQNTMVGLVGALESIPFLLFSPLAGVLADRMDRKTLIIASDLVSGGCMLALGIACFGKTKPPVEFLLVNAFVLSSARVFFTPAKNAAIASIVPGDRLLEASALNGSTQGIAPLIGLTLSAALLGAFYAISRATFFSMAVIADAATFLISAAFCTALPSLIPSQDAKERHPWTDFKEGIRYIRSRRVLWIALVMGLVSNLVISPFFVVYVAANEAWFGGKPATLSWIEASFFLGLVVGSVLVGLLKIRRAGLSLIVGYSICGLTILAMAFLPHLGPWLTLNFFAGVAMMGAALPFQAYRQKVVPTEFQGRVQSSLVMATQGVMPIGQSLGGLLLDRVGIAGSFAAMGIGLTAASLASGFDRSFRDSHLNEEAA